MPIAPFESIGDAVTFNNTKLYGDYGAFIAGSAGANLNAHLNRVNLLGESIAASWANRMVTPDPVEAISTQKMLTGRDSQGIAESMSLATQLLALAKQ